MAHGTLRVYLGAAPGVGKTYAMLAEGRRQRRRGVDVVIGFMEDYGRRMTRLMAEGLETVPRHTLVHRGARFTEMDLDAVLRRRPELALVDEIAHTNVPGSRNVKRWQDIEELRAAGIDVLTTVNIQHLESLNEVVERITEVRQRETVPDAVVRAADQIEVVDMSADALRRRMSDGFVYAPEKVDDALNHYFRVGNLTALRELALLWAADRVDEALQRYRTEAHIHRPWAARERVVVALSGGPEGDTLIRRAERIVARGAGGELLAVHVVRADGLAGAAPELLDRQRALVERAGGSYHEVTAEDPAAAVLDFAREHNASQIVIGATRRGRLGALFHRSIATAIVQGSGEDFDCYVVTHEEAAHGRLLRGGRRTST
ncbi:universal stress protein [Streptomyces millisiae]|uniref:Universal stress protein n=1 Tax=Streptomyces millisiae TaxID=3075542 RepID=A0ABU2LMT3_9ACTN|nr:universal stress protein [Streptomyces sp. DSM 44918]MDT0318373.1 universal stress protein [Streptomyces sp. DSM 44918]